MSENKFCKRYKNKATYLNSPQFKQTVELHYIQSSLTMYSKLIVFFIAFFGVLAVALPNNPPTVTVTVTSAAPTQTAVSQCNTGTLFS